MNRSLVSNGRRAGARRDWRRGRHRRWARQLALVAVLLAVLASLAACEPLPPEGSGPTPEMHLVVLVVDDGSEMVAAIADRLAVEGVRTQRLDLSSPSRPQITHAFLGEVSGTEATANYSGVVVPSEATPGLSEGERSILADYERWFGVREVVAYTWANPAVGLNYAENPGYIGPVDGFQTTLTPLAASTEFNYLDGPVTLDDLDPAVEESWGYLATPLPHSAAGEYHPLVTAQIPGTTTAGSLLGIYKTPQREQMVSTFASNGSQEHFNVLAHGIVRWLTKNISTSYYRNRFSVQVDDVFLPDDRWSVDGNCTIGDGCDPATYPPEAPGASVRMNDADVAAAVAWQDANGFTMDLAFNAAGAEEAGPTDPLTTGLVAERNDFRWTNHTWSHPYLGCLQDSSVTPWRCASILGVTLWQSRFTISSEIEQNRTWAQAKAIPLDGTELVTGEHSGLASLPQMPSDNPELAPALNTSGISWIASDASREADTRPVGQALTVPRHPMNIYYNTGTEAEAADEYNWIYTSRANGGSGTCEDHPETTTCITPLNLTTGFDDYIVPIERRIAFSHVVGLSPRPHYAHQSNLAEDRVLYPVLAGVLDHYRETFADNTPLVNDRLSEVGAEMKRQQDWRNATNVVTTATGHKLEVKNTGPNAVRVPLTVPEGTLDVVTLDANGDIATTGDPTGTPYAGQRSTWVTVPAGGSVVVKLPNQHTFRTPAHWPLEEPSPVPPPTPGAVVDGPTTEVVEAPEALSEVIAPQQTDDGSAGPTPDVPAGEPSPGADTSPQPPARP